MSDLPSVVSDSELSNSFLSEAIQICVVSRDHKRTMRVCRKILCRRTPGAV